MTLTSQSRLALVGLTAGLVISAAACSITDHRQTQDMFNDAVAFRATNPIQARALFETVIHRTQDTYELNVDAAKDDDVTVSGPLIDLSGLGAAFGLVTTPEPDLQANAMYMLAEAAVQVGKYDLARQAASAGLKSNPGAIDEARMRLVKPMTTLRQILESFGVGADALAVGQSAGTRLRVDVDAYKAKVADLVQVLRQICEQQREFESDQSVSPGAGAALLFEREQVRLLRQWQIIVADLKNTTGGEKKKLRSDALMKIAGELPTITGAGSWTCFEEAYCPIRDSIDPTKGGDAAYLRYDVDERILSATSADGTNPCDANPRCPP